MDPSGNYLEEHLDEVRAQFDLTNYWVYLNVGDQAIPGAYWLKAVRDFFDFQERGRMDDIPIPEIATHPFLTTSYYEATAMSAKLIGADTEEVTLAYRPLQVCNLVINDLLDWEPGDNVVFTDLSYPSFPYTFLNLRDRYGVELRRVENVAGAIRMEDMEAAIDDRTKLVSVCRTTPFCGFTYDMKELCRIAHAHGAYVLDDAFQAVGAIEVDVHHDDVDFLVTGSYKWQCGPEGAGLFYVRKDLIPQLEPSYRNYLAIEMPRGIPFSLHDHDNMSDWDHPQVQTAEKFSLGAVSGPSVFGWLATLRFLDKLGMKNIERRVRRLGQYTVEAVRETGLEILSPTDPALMHGMVTCTTGSFEKDNACFQHLGFPGLGKRPIKVSVRGLGNVGGIRICTHFYNTTDEVDYLVREIGEFMAANRG